MQFFGLEPAALDTLLLKWNWPAYRGNQLRHWVYERLVTDPQAMTNFSRRDQEFLAEHIEFSPATVAANQFSSDGTRKLLLAWANGQSAESVMIPDGPRRTACISSQVGCPVGCRFCASGIGGVRGNLSAAQIVEQIFRLNQILQPSSPPNNKITNIVFMGMGEPLANYAAVMSAIRILHDPGCFNIGARKITLSTVGVPARMRQLAAEGLPINLALSLHAPNEPLRKQLIPWAEHFALDDILNAAREYFDRTGREITLEYILLQGVNDRPEHARQLAKLCKTIRANVNLIRYNEVAGLPFIRPHADDVMRFQQILRDAGVNAHVRKSRGRDIDAACGQLRRKAESAPAPIGLPEIGTAKDIV
ncbi:MAG TPA: 23S rRNA (adenine(2503)-C(2))-methyltransferase RlmN [Tepidisphaeraceae bacterium]|nr:23S rRNA (adenine(2503)-C(2))-methyltransferase RlmN [Tepidisphaeraceae bacterium]